MFRYDVLCIGSATVDHFITISELWNKVKLGDKILIEQTEMHSGGGATNSSVALAKMGLKVKILTKFGQDHNAELISKELREHRIKNICRHHSRRQTDSSFIIHSLKEKDRVIFVHKGASLDLEKDDFRKSQLRAEWFYLASPMEKSWKIAQEVVNFAQRKKKSVLFNPSLYLAEKGVTSLRKVLSKTTLLVLNKQEAQALLQKTVGTKAMLSLLQKLGPEKVVITDGAKKMWAVDGIYYYCLTPPNIKVVHTAGAGDAFTSGLLAGLIKNYSFSEALALGQANASSIIQHIGTKTGLLSETEALKLVKKYRIKVRRC